MPSAKSGKTICVVCKSTKNVNPGNKKSGTLALCSKCAGVICTKAETFLGIEDQFVKSGSEFDSDSSDDDSDDSDYGRSKKKARKQTQNSLGEK